MASAELPSCPLSPPAYLVALDAGFSHREYGLGRTALTIGRDGSRSDIVLAGATVSRCHVRVCQDEEGRFLLHDLGSTNGVFVNGARIKEAVALQDGDL